MIKAKRFWQEVAIEPSETGYKIFLDERELKTPYKNPLHLPSLALAESVAEEWRMVQDEIKPDEMPMTKMSNSAVERIPKQRAEIENHLLDYVEHDLLAYRAAEPEKLAERQKAWDEPLDWARNKDITITTVTGIIAPPSQPQNRIAAQKWLGNLNDFDLVAFHEFVTISGSFVLAMMVMENALSASEAFNLSRLDEDFQGEIWGRVDVKEEERAQKAADFDLAARFWELSKPSFQ